MEQFAHYVCVCREKLLLIVGAVELHLFWHLIQRFHHIQILLGRFFGNPSSDSNPSLVTNPPASLNVFPPSRWIALPCLAELRSSASQSHPLLSPILFAFNLSSASLPISPPLHFNRSYASLSTHSASLSTPSASLSTASASLSTTSASLSIATTSLSTTSATLSNALSSPPTDFASL